MKLQQKILIGVIALIPIGCLAANFGPYLVADQTDDAIIGLVMLGGYFVTAIGCLGILGCAIFWRWDESV